MKKYLVSIFLLLFIFSSCGSSNDNGDSPDPSTDVRTLKIAPFKVGFAVDVNLLRSNTVYRQTVINEVNSLTAENAMKMGNLSSARNVYNWNDADYVVDFATKNDMRVHGHTLLWYRDVPQWVENFSGDRNAWIALMKEYIQTVVGRYKGKIAAWDVVNEAFEDDGQYRKTIWYRNIGAEYIDLAFQFAREADSSTLLFYNDYGMEYSAAKRTAITNLVNDMKSRNIPIDGIGLQMHIDMFRSKAYFTLAINMAASCNVKVHISELDVATNPDKDPKAKFTAEVALKQKTSYKAMAEALLAIPADQQYGLTIWGINDAYSWLTDNPDWGLPFDKDFKKKPAYDGLIEAFNK